MTTVTLARPRSLFVPGPSRRGFLMGLAAGLTVGLFLLVGLSIGLAFGYQGRILPGVQVAGVSIGGLDRSAAEVRLRTALPSLDDGQAAVIVDGAPVVISYAEIGRDYELNQMLDAAFGVGRDGNPLSDGVARLRMLRSASFVPVIIHHYDDAALDEVVARIVSDTNRDPVDASISVSDSDGWVVSPSAPGAAIDDTALRSQLAAAIAGTDATQVTVRVRSSSLAPELTTSDARVAATAARWMSEEPLRLRAGGGRFKLGSAAIAGLISFGPGGDEALAPLVDEAGVHDWLTDLAPSLVRDPVNASYTFDANGVSGIVPGVRGRELNVSASVSAIVDALNGRARGALVPAAALTVSLTQPAFSTAAARAAAPEMRQISTWTTSYVPGEGNYWGANISIPARDLDAMLIAPGEWFSFWDGIGPITTARGYGYGGAIIGGRSVANGALAGGICSTSTTLFNAAMRAGLEIGDRTNHYYYIDRYPTGLDATVFQTDTYEVNMTFRNDTTEPIVIRSYTGTGFVRFDIWGVPDGRTVALSRPIITNPRAARETTVVNPSLKPGTSVRVEYMHDGFDSSVTRTVRDADGNVIWRNTWFSHYSAVNGITEVGPARTASRSNDDNDN